MKKVNIEISCDSCKKNLSPHLSTYSSEYILRVSVENIAEHESGQAVYAMAISPPIKCDLHFCGLTCMKAY